MTSTTMLRHHLAHNLYPPPSSPRALDIALAAIAEVSVGRPDTPVAFSPNGAPASAFEVVEAWHLDGFCEPDFDTMPGGHDDV